MLLRMIWTRPRACPRYSVRLNSNLNRKKKKNWHGFKIFGVKIINWRIMNFRSVSLFAGVFDNNLTNQSSHLYSSLLGIPTSDRNNDI